MAEKKRKSMAENIHLKKLPRIDEDEEFVDTEPLSLPGQPLKIEKKSGLCFIVKKEYHKSRSKFFNRIHSHDATLLLNRKQDRVSRYAARVKQCNTIFLKFFSGKKGETAACRVVQSKAVALSYSQLLKDIHNTTQSQLTAARHLFKLLTRHMIVRRLKKICLNKIVTQTADVDVDVDVDVEELVTTDHQRLSSIFRDRHQAVVNLSREVVKKMNEIQDCFSVFQSCPTDFVSHALLSNHVVLRYRGLLKEIDQARRAQIAGVDKIKELRGKKKKKSKQESSQVVVQ